MPHRAPETVAAVDLGSNSFHMLVAKVMGDRLQVVDRIREMVRLAGGLDSSNRLRGETSERALACLRRFGQRLDGVPPGSVRAVGTNTLRKARNAEAFIDQAEAALGHRIDIIAGAEEARLIYLGVAHSIEGEGGRRLVIDIGGGSTEVIIGHQFEAERLESLYIGCVAASQAYFPDGRIDAACMRRAKLAARLEFEHIEAAYRQLGWETALGASGTILAINDLAIAHRWSSDGITPAALAALEAELCAAGHVDRLALTGLDPERAPVFPGGVAILSAAFDALRIERMRVSPGALREGLLYDLIGRFQHEDARERTVADLVRRYQVDVAHGTRVAQTAQVLFAQVAQAWGLSAEIEGQCLSWAAQLHEVGLGISHSQYHKHGGYLLRYHDMPGFGRQEQQRLAALVRMHRRKFAGFEEAELPPDDAAPVRRLAVLLRVAVLLHRSRSAAALPAIEAEGREEGLRLRFPQGWLEEHPLSQADLEQEAEFLKADGFKLKFR